MTGPGTRANPGWSSWATYSNIFYTSDFLWHICAEVITMRNKREKGEFDDGIGRAYSAAAVCRSLEPADLLRACMTPEPDFNPLSFFL